uniref:Uncharacterized protein n=1 Tax=Escherichia coli TaxID=562 RepID=A0A7L8KAB2_ECOLX|nr:hypothetical protein [Escherichia coli]
MIAVEGEVRDGTIYEVVITLLSDAANSLIVRVLFFRVRVSKKTSPM